LNEPAVPIDEDDDESNLEEDAGDIPIVLLDLETSGFEASCDIQQTIAKCRKTTSATYIKSSRKYL
jgi:hypothetical protein